MRNAHGSLFEAAVGYVLDGKFANHTLNSILKQKMTILFVCLIPFPGTLSRTLQVVKDLGDGHAAVRVGAATTNIEMLNWSKK